jgi:hypothetical protein
MSIYDAPHGGAEETLMQEEAIAEVGRRLSHVVEASGGKILHDEMAVPTIYC